MSSPKDAYEGLAHPMRRDILDLLRDQPAMAAGDIAAHFPQVSRAAVSKHLGVLRGAGLVHADPWGRESRYSVAPGPLREMREGWLSTFEPLWEQSLQNLKKQVEGEP